VDPNGFALIHEKVKDQDKMIHRAKKVLGIKTPHEIYSPSGLILETESGSVHTHLFATFLTENLNTAMTICRTLGMKSKDVMKAAENISGPSGRFEVINTKDKPLIIIDYAHTPAGLERLLKEVTTLKKKISRTKVTLVVGAGGDRDTTKRPLSGTIGSKYADRLVVTDDNPRTESPTSIRKAIVAGIPTTYQGIVKNVNDRKKAIEWALKTAKQDEIVVLAGKGHETYQIIGKEKFPFDERVIVKQIFKNK
jgi:UDP-N-acetylmuramoyl-L-alanyl-D-glutamate--2,6-diaminopimelate ligase